MAVIDSASLVSGLVIFLEHTTRVVDNTLGMEALCLMKHWDEYKSALQSHLSVIFGILVFLQCCGEEPLEVMHSQLC